MAVYKLTGSSVKNGKTEYSSFLAGNPVFNPGSYESIATVSVGSGGSSSISFTSIPGTYKHLQVRSVARITAGAVLYMGMRFNSDSASNYSLHTLYGDGASAVTEYSSTTYAVPGINGGTANILAANVLDILDYSNTNKFKTTRVLDGVDVNGSGGYVMLTSSCWRSTSAITSIEIFANSFNTFAQYSHFALYGIKEV
jgi:hypothetical protein